MVKLKMEMSPFDVVVVVVVEVLLYVHRNSRFHVLGTGAQDVHLDFHTAPVL